MVLNLYVDTIFKNSSFPNKDFRKQVIGVFKENFDLKISENELYGFLMFIQTNNPVSSNAEGIPLLEFIITYYFY